MSDDRHVHLQLLPALQIVCLSLQVLLLALPHARALNADLEASTLCLLCLLGAHVEVDAQHNQRLSL